MTRSVRDCAAALDATAGPAPGDPYAALPPERPYRDEVGRDPGPLRIAFSSRSPTGGVSDPECVQAVTDAARACESLGHRVDEAQPLVDWERLTEAFLRVWAAGTTYQLESLGTLTGREPSPDLVEPLTWALLERGRTVSAAEYQGAIGSFQITGRQMGGFMEQRDVWICPTLAKPPLRLGVIDTRLSDVDRAFEPMLDYAVFTPIMNATGQPAISLPLHQSASGLPIGVQLSARIGDEGTLLALAAQLEQAMPWIDRKPSLWD